jgi:hypothetical protein
MNKITSGKIRSRIYSFCIPPILVFLMSTHCEGVKSLYIINCLNDVAVVQTSSLDDRWQQIPLDYYNNRNPDLQLKSTDTIFPKLQVEYFQMWYDTRGNIEINGDTLSISLEPGESVRIAYSGWLFYPCRIREVSLDVDNLTIITNSNTCVVRNRKEILRLQKDIRFRYDRHYEDKVGPDTRQKRKILIK